MFGQVQPLMKENVLGQPPRPLSLRKKIFGKPVAEAEPFGAPESPFGKTKLSAFAGQRSKSPLFKRLTGK